MKNDKKTVRFSSNKLISLVLSNKYSWENAYSKGISVSLECKYKIE